jgi:beta-lactamase superfamily II metal-dependent hydrolase
MPHKTTTDAPESLEIHVLGAGKGESIVLGWPGNCWGVVDCYAPSLNDHATNPTLQFLRGRGVSELEFLCLTHPHDDHFRGMSQLLEHLKVKHFWRFPTISVRELKRLAKYMVEDTERGDVAELKENANDFVRTMTIVNERRESNQLDQMLVNGHQQLYPVPFDQSAQFQVWGFAPHGNQLGHYEQALTASFTAEGQLRANPPHVSHNDISVGLLVVFGKTRVVLGGDVERAAWADICSQHKREHFFVDAVKVPHHGSETGFIPGLWGDLAGRKKPIAVIAPYRRFRLPKRDTLQHIGEHASKIMLTCEIDLASAPCAVRPPLKSRMFLRTRLRARSPIPDDECGRCSLTFDTEGNCIAEDYAGSACQCVIEN